MNMKIHNLFLVLLIMLSGCRNDPAADTSGTSQEYMRIAENFRSESSIVVSEEDEIWIGSFDNKKLVDATFEAIYNGDIIAYDLLNEPLSIEYVKSIERSIDTIAVENIETGENEMQIIEQTLNRSTDYVKVFVKENWDFDPKEFKMKKEVVNMTFTSIKFDIETGDALGYEALFTVYFSGHDPPEPL